MTDETIRFGPPVDLAQESDFVLGDLLISPSTRQVSRDGTRETLEPRVMQVLVALARSGGRVISRDELIARCWEGRIVGEDAINRAIGRLRRLSEADAEASFQIETIPRVGYRLEAAQKPEPQGASESVALPNAPSQQSSAPVRQGVLFRHRLAIAAAIVVAGAAAAAWLFWPERQWTVESGRPFAASLALEGDPAFSPDGSTLAYSVGPDGGQRKIFVRNLAGADGIKVTNDDFDDTAPSWSSDGGHIAYIGIRPGEPCHLMVATVPAGAVREVGRCRRANTTFIAWRPGTNFLYFMDRGALTGDSILRLDLDSGAQMVMVHMPHLNQTIRSLRCSPDGKWLAYILKDSIVIRDLGGATEKILAAVDPRGNLQVTLAWTPDSRTVLAGTSGGIGSQISAFPIDGRPSYRVYATATRIGNMAAGANDLAVVSDISRVNLARPVATATAGPDVTDAANGYTWSPSFAPDGTLAFLSNRSGTNAIWIQKHGAAAVQLFDGGFAPIHRVRFSPDGSRLAVLTDSVKSVEIKIMALNGTTLRSFMMPSEGLGLPSWTQDGKALLVFDGKDKRTWRVDADNPDKRSPFTPPHWVGTAVRPEGTFATRVDKPGIWRIDGDAPSLVTGKYPAYYDPPMAFRDADVLVPEYPGTTPRLLAQPLSGGPDRLLGYMPGAAHAPDFQTGLAVDPKTGDIVYTAMVGHDTNIDLLALAKR